MHNRRRRKAKARRKIGQLIEQLRPEGSSPESRASVLERLYSLHEGIKAVFYAPHWY